jgi:serine/threonine-protein kinase RsbW
MHRHDYAYAYHEPPPSDLPSSGWKRAELHAIEDLGWLAKQLENEMKNLDYPRKDSFAAGLVLREAVVNAIRHGHRLDCSRTVLVSYHLTPEAVYIEVADEGLGFDPYLVPDLFDDPRRRGPARGRGLLLMRLYTSWIRFNQRGNRVILCKWRSTPSGYVQDQNSACPS